MTAIEARTQLHSLRAERVDAAEVGLDRNILYRSSLEDDIVAARLAYVGLAVTEIATLRARIGGPQVG
ncbi:MAG: hypothetical protein H0V26_03300 [Solirubrobacterales bacterium]|nr:hypothetical protein [Solirubrobacterales bacterium]